MKKLHLITAVTRPYNLPRIVESITETWREDWEIVWHLVYDPEKKSKVGHSIKSGILDGIDDGYCLILDDDTIIHPELLDFIDAVLEKNPEVWGFVVSQEREDGTILAACPESVAVNQIDAAQAVIRRDKIGVSRLPEVYNGDGIYLVSILKDKENVAYTNEVLSYHNFIK